MADARAKIPARGPDFEQWVASRAADLNQHSPLVQEVQAFEYARLPEASDDPAAFQGFAALYDWIDPRCVLRTAADTTWNAIDRSGRDRVVEEICASLRDAATPDERYCWLEAISVGGFDLPVIVDLVPGPAGPVYELTQNGVHRTHAARILGLPLMMVEVRIGGLPYPTYPLDKFPAPIGRRERLWTALHRRGVFSAEVHDGIWDIDHVRAEWMLLEPAVAVETNRAYERLYPGSLSAFCGLPSDVLTDEEKWVAALMTPPRVAWWRRIRDSLGRETSQI